jgi:steroid delta-isomerase-like uncharacterized protein
MMLCVSNPERRRAQNDMTPADLVESFYADVWNKRDFDVARRIISDDFRFRGSLGPEKRGIDGFLDYVETIHHALADYTCVIDDLVVEGDKAAARMTFRGHHQGRFFGAPPTNRHISWSGAAFFRCTEGQIAELWVLGDIDAVKQQLGVASGASL